MKIVLLVAICIANGVYSREEIDEDSFAQLTDELLHEIEKRLQDDPETFDALAKSGLFEGILPECQRIISNNSIIKTDTSLKNGALFLGTPNVKSFDECFEQCCDTDKCTTAIFKSREDAMACYLFNCGSPNLCEFTDHADFYVMSVTQSPTKIAENHESELDNLVPVETSTTSTVTSTPTTSTPSTTTELRPPSALFGTCRTAKNCAGTATDCLAGYCVCQDGYHAQDGTCRKDCTRFQFECRNDGNPLTYPQCIAIYDKCDGIQHCTDNSDEENCPSDVINGNPSDAKPNPKDDSQPPTVDVVDAGDKQVVPDSDLGQHEPDTGEKSTEVESTENKDEDIPTDSETGGESSPEPSSEVHDEDPNQAQESDQSEESSESSEEGKDLHEGSKEKGKGDGHHDNKTFSVVEEDLIVVKDISSQSNKTAVVALSLGLIITAMLLLFVGCRLRNVRKRLRKGRPMNSNEADYLINGMYL